MAELEKKRYEYSFEGGGWNTVWAKTKKKSKNSNTIKNGNYEKQDCTIRQDQPTRTKTRNGSRLKGN